MLLEELKNYFGTWALMSRELGLGATTYLGWKRKGYIPYKTQCVLEMKTKRKFKANLEHCKPQKMDRVLENRA